MRKFVAVCDVSGSIFCLGVFDSYYEAFGRVMDSVYEFKESYKAPENKFTISDPYETEGEGGIAVEVTYKAANWNEPRMGNYCVLFCDD